MKPRCVSNPKTLNPKLGAYIEKLKKNLVMVTLG